MSSRSTRKPEFRLHMGYPYITLTREGEDTPLGLATPEAHGFVAALRGLAAEVARTHGRITVTLPAAEIWRGLLDLSGRPLVARHRAARQHVAAELGVPTQALTVVLGPQSTSGETPVAAVRRDTLCEALTLLSSVGIRPAAVYGEGSYPGFDAPPRLAGRWRIALIALFRRRRPAAVVAGALPAAAAAIFLALPSNPPATLPERPVAPPPATLASRAQVSAPDVPDLQPRAAPPLRIVLAERPVPRPAPPPVLLEAAHVTVATRNLPSLVIEPRRTASPDLRLAELTTAGTSMVDAIEIPLRRPTSAEVPVPVAELGPVPDLRPAHRPGRPPAASTVRTSEQAAPSRPRPRPGTPKALVLAALAPATSATIKAAGTGTPPLARPEGRRTETAATPRAVAPAPRQPARVTTAAVPKNVVMRTQPTQILRVAPAASPQRVVRVQPASVPRKVATPAPPKPVRAQAPAPTKTVQRVAAAPTTRTGLSRGNVALIGVFGAQSGRHALLRLPNGTVQRVRAGDSVQGVQVAAVGADSVRLSGRGRDTLLRLPD